MNISIAHICIYTRDLEASQKFYCDGLGMKKVFDFTLNGQLYGFYLEMSPGNFIEVFLNAEFDAENRGPLRHLCLETDDIVAMRDRLNRGGIVTTEITRGCDQTFQFWFRDPSGNDIEFHQYTAESAQFTGTDCEVDWVKSS